MSGENVRVAVLEGDGIGPEVVSATSDVVGKALTSHGVSLEAATLPYGGAAIAEFDDPVPQSTLESLEGFDLWLVGPHDSAGYRPDLRHPAPGAVLRKRFDLYANLRPAKAMTSVPATAPEIDLLIVRENSEGLYADRNMAFGSGEFMPTPDVALSVGLVTRAASERIAVEAFEAARRRRGHVTVVHKANVLRLTTGLFRDVCLQVGERYPDVRVDTVHVDAMAAALVRRPADFDVVVTENLFGDILSDLAGELSGSLGLAASLNTSADRAMAQAVHGAAPDIAGRGVADPIAMIGSAVLLLRWHADRSGSAAVAGAADSIEAALAHVLADGVATADLGGSASTREFADAVVDLV